MSSEIIKVPDIGGDTDVEIIEIAVSEGDVIEAEDTLITLESDKASMDVPAPQGGKVIKVLVKEGDTVSEGDAIVEIEAEGGGDSSGGASAESDAPDQAASEPAPAPASEAPKAAAPAGGKQTVDIKVPDLGGSDNVEIIEVAVSAGDEVNAEDTLITLESDKASMDVPSPHGGKLIALTVKEGDTVSEGDVIGQMEIAGGSGGADSAPASSDAQPAAEPAPAAPQQAAPEPSGGGAPERKEIRVPDLSGSSDVPIIEIGVAAGDEVDEEDALITLESDKASMDVPSPYKGKLLELTVKEGDTVSEGDVIGYIEVAGAPGAAAPAPAPAKEAPQAPAAAQAPAAGGAPSPEAQVAAQKPRDAKLVHAGPAVRMLARELGVDLGLVKPTGPKERVLKEDVQNYVKQALANPPTAKPGASPAAAAGGAGIPPIPEVDFSQFGEVEEKPMGRLLKMGATNLHRSWLNVPHVTQFDEADITELEAFRKAMKAEAEAQGAKLTPLPFMVKA
ncbi:MAG: biotin/lipoyl-containing protein, partial [Pseudomonadota bacterium]